MSLWLSTSPALPRLQDSVPSPWAVSRATQGSVVGRPLGRSAVIGQGTQGVGTRPGRAVVLLGMLVAGLVGPRGTLQGTVAASQVDVAERPCAVVLGAVVAVVAWVPARSLPQVSEKVRSEHTRRTTFETQGSTDGYFTDIYSPI